MTPHRPDSHSNTAINRIAALLFALADLAERAAGRSAAVRILILLILRPAEAMARRLAMDFYADTDFAPLLHVLDGDGSTAAVRLALSLRMLAMALAALPDWAFDGGGELRAADRWLRTISAPIDRLGAALCHFREPARPEVRAGLASGVS